MTYARGAEDMLDPHVVPVEAGGPGQPHVVAPVHVVRVAEVLRAAALRPRPKRGVARVRVHHVAGVRQPRVQAHVGHGAAAGHQAAVGRRGPAVPQLAHTDHLNLTGHVSRV